MQRRTFLGLAAAAVPLLATEAVLGKGLGRERRRLLQLNGYPSDAETPLDALATYLTPNDLFFVRHHWQPQLPDPAQWTLSVDGEVERPLSLTLKELKGLPSTSVTCVLQCAGNGRALFTPRIPGVQWTAGAVGNARYIGVRVRELLDRAGLKATARHLHTFGADTPPRKVPPFHRSLELGKALEDAIVAYEMNGDPLPALHGAPARLVVPGWAGDHWMKWLVRLSPQPEPQTGFYMDVAYRYPLQPGAPGTPVRPEETAPVTELLVKSSFTQVPKRAHAGRPVTVWGFAFSGTPDVSRVEVSADGGQSWKDALLDGRHDRWAWRLFSHTFVPRSRGPLTLLARATDSRGGVQPKEGVWNPSGYLHNGWASASLEVDA